MRRRPDLLVATDDQSRRRRLARRLAAIGMSACACAGAGMRVAAAACLWLRALLLLGHRVSSERLYQQRGMFVGNRVDQ